ncbi:MAG: diacylglycerol kinase [Treponema sp.]|jgi:diacylglycerol kinase family enzyme|nr:diacylglycerol kinase [Treponema sp.]
MKSADNLALFGAGIAKICAHTPLAKDKPLRWSIIANPKAGGFTITSRWKKHAADLDAAVEKAGLHPLHKDAAPSGVGCADVAGLSLTGKAGDARQFAEAVIAAMARDDAFHLIITAGGDGTSLEVLTAFFYAGESLRKRCAVLRLPMGTGNDGSDAWELGKALDLIVSPSKVTFTPAVRLACAGADKGPFLAFNILSVGLDAFVTHNTNKMKGALPGDSYKLWVDIASLLYDRIYTVGHMDITLFDEAGAEIRSLSGKPLLLAVGASGRRTYGSRKRILPDDRNVCIVWQMPAYRKLLLKNTFTTGTHIDKPEVALFAASRVEFQGEHPILAQMDGETVSLAKEDFPCGIALTEPVIPVLQPAPVERKGGRFSA